MKKIIAAFTALTIAVAVIMFILLDPFSGPHTRVYWVVTDQSQNNEVARYLYCFDMETRKTTIEAFEGYIISGDTSGEGFYYVDNITHKYGAFSDWGLYLPPDPAPFDIYRYTQDGVQLIKQDLVYDELCLVLAYDGEDLWYVNGHDELVRADESGETVIYPNLYSESDNFGELYPVTPSGQKMLYITSLPEEHKNLQPDLEPVPGLDAVPAIALQSPEGEVTVLHCDSEDKYEEYTCPVWDEANSRIYYFSTRPGDDIFTCRLMRYDLITGENIEYTVLNYTISDMIPVALSPDGEWLFANFYNDEFNGIAALSLSGEGLIRIFDRYEDLEAEGSLYHEEYSHIAVISAE